MTKYLTEKEFKKILRSVSPTEEVSDIIAEKMKNRIIFSKGKCYILLDNLTYKASITEPDILPIITKFIYDSWKKLDEDKQEDIENMFKNYNRIFTNTDIKKYLPQLIYKLTDDNLKFDLYFKQLHFKNGYFDMETRTFKKRVLGMDYVTEVIKRDYNPAKAKYKDKLMKELQKIYPKKRVLEAILRMLGSALTGLSVKESYLMFLLGDSSAGKSTILELMRYSTEMYVRSVVQDLFIEGKNTNKAVNTFQNETYIRISWLNEPKDKKFDSSFLKSWADGECNTEKLFKEGSHEFRHYSLTIFTSNTMPNIQVSQGVHRRMRVYNHTSTFTTDKSKVNEEKHIYLTDEDFKNNFNGSDEMKDALVEILMEHAHEWLNSRKIGLPEEFTECTHTLLDMNNQLQDFIDGKLKITGVDHNRIGKQQMMKMFNTAYPNKHLTELQLISELKSRGITYDRKRRVNNIQGCFTGVEPRGSHDDEENVCVEDYRYLKKKAKESEQKISFLYALLAKNKIEIDDSMIEEYVKNLKDDDEEEEDIKDDDVEVKEIEEVKPKKAEKVEKVEKVKVTKEENINESKDTKETKKKSAKTTKVDNDTGYVVCTDKTNPFY